MNTNKTMCTSSLLMELSKVGNKIKSAGKNKQCTMQVKDITIDIMSKKRVWKFISLLLQIYYLNAIIFYPNLIFLSIRGVYENFFNIIYII